MAVTIPVGADKRELVAPCTRRYLQNGTNVHRESEPVSVGQVGKESGEWVRGKHRDIGGNADQHLQWQWREDADKMEVGRERTL
jgi:hypothetical protein